MSEGKNREQLLRELAEKAVERYARGLLAVDELVVLLAQEGQKAGDDLPEKAEVLLKRLAQSFCSQILCEGCLSSDGARREQAFENLWRYMERILVRMVQGAGASELVADVLQQTMVEILNIFQRRGAGPDRSASFLKWTRVILLRQLGLYRRREYREDWDSLEMQPDAMLEEIVDWKALDPLQKIVSEERRIEIHKAIATLKNPRYRRVLTGTYFAEKGEHELAEDWQVRIQDIYLWRFRALKALRKQSRIVQEYKKEA